MNDLTCLSFTTRSFRLAAATRLLGLSSRCQPRDEPKREKDIHCIGAPIFVLNPIASGIRKGRERSTQFWHFRQQTRCFSRSIICLSPSKNSLLSVSLGRRAGVWEVEAGGEEDVDFSTSRGSFEESGVVLLLKRSPIRRRKGDSKRQLTG